MANRPIIYSDHFLDRCQSRGVTEAEVLAVMDNPEKVVPHYYSGRPMMGFCGDGMVVCAAKFKGAWSLVTVLMWDQRFGGPERDGDWTDADFRADRKARRAQRVSGAG